MVHVVLLPRSQTLLLFPKLDNLNPDESHIEDELSLVQVREALLAGCYCGKIQLKETERRPAVAGASPITPICIKDDLHQLKLGLLIFATLKQATVQRAVTDIEIN